MSKTFENVTMAGALWTDENGQGQLVQGNGASQTRAFVTIPHDTFVELPKTKVTREGSTVSSFRSTVSITGDISVTDLFNANDPSKPLHQISIVNVKAVQYVGRKLAVGAKPEATTPATAPEI
jgi:hypothetical protein